MPPSCHRRAPCVRIRSAASPAGFTLGGSSKYRAIASIHPGRVVGGSRGATGVNPTDGMGAALTSHQFQPAGQGADVGQHRRRNPHLPSDEGRGPPSGKSDAVCVWSRKKCVRHAHRLPSSGPTAWSSWVQRRASRAPWSRRRGALLGPVGAGSAADTADAAFTWPPGRCRCGTGRPQG